MTCFRNHTIYYSLGWLFSHVFLSFGKDICPISDIFECTRNTQEVLLKMNGQGKGIKLIDVPGVAESSSRDKICNALFKIITRIRLSVMAYKIR